MTNYNHKNIESKWQKEWEAQSLHRADDKSQKPKYYCLIEFPYPSGEGLHTGHIRSNTAMDIIARKRRAEGYNVLYPIGWDAFGLPTENYAIKMGIHPKIVTKKNTDNFRRQLKSIGFSFDWEREINTTDPKYYKWTQWIFLQFLKKGLAYKAKMPINWCLSCKIGLANEEVIDGKCARCGGQTEKREKEQWMLAITQYADRLDKDLDDVNYLENIKIAQRNWIGKSEGAQINFQLISRTDADLTRTDAEGLPNFVEVFTTRPDTLFGATFLAVSAELAQKWVDIGWQAKADVGKYIQKTIRENSKRGFDEKEKTGVFSDIYAINPANQEKIPVWVVNYVLGGVGTGAIMAVPAHDERDFAFAKKYKIPITQVIEPLFVDTKEPSAYRANEPIVERDGIAAIVKHWKEDTYMCLAWKKVAWHTWITGGIEKGQTPEEAALMEIKEETGFTSVVFKQNLGKFHSLFYHNPKNENRLVHADVLYFELQNNEQIKVSDEEKSKHDVRWYPAAELKNTLTAEAHCYALKLLVEQISVYTGVGILTASERFSGMDSEEAKGAITKFVGGKMTTTYKLRDWVFSRQRYWGEPIPVVHCKKCALSDPAGQGIVPVLEKDLPILLPEVELYTPTDTGESPLAQVAKWVNTKCPKCSGPAKRETDTMPNWAGSSWYYLRYIDPENDKEFADKKKLKYWTPVDWYNGGMEHTTLHLLYSRFWHKFLFDIGAVPTHEPYQKRTAHGMILAAGGVKMSKSKGNVVSPDDIVTTYGADTLRLYEMFMGPFNQSVEWSGDGIIGPRRFIEKVWRIHEKVSEKSGADLSTLVHQTIKKITEDIESMGFNTAVSQMMILANAMERAESVSRGDYGLLLRVLAPFAPHVTEELWQTLGYKKSIHLEPWPKWDEEKIKEESVMIMVQVNGKIRGSFTASAGISDEEVKKHALAEEGVRKWIEGKEIKKVIYIKGKLISIVI